MKKQPNVIIVMTDDQGYGDLACTGNPWIQTPNIDQFYQESVRFTDFHVSPLCTPTRGAIMSGHLPMRNGAWATTWGRCMVRADEILMPEFFRKSGYKTGMFGKWHLGDSFPYRPHDRGFETVVAHKGGGVGQTPDFWGNTYFDDTYFHNGKPVEHTGYCTDIWFDEAIKFIEDNKNEAFFCYLATNAPHGPYRVDEKYAAQYRNNEHIPHPDFYGMITNIDENFGKLDRTLKELGIADDTILIFMTDNGTSGGVCLDPQAFPIEGKGYNAGMRGMKGSYYEGGHRVPFFIRWPNGNASGGKDIDEQVHHVDMLPTFIDICHLDNAKEVQFDGASFATLLNNESNSMPERYMFMQYRQNTNPPDKWFNGVLKGQWRLINGQELYDVKADFEQRQDIANRHPEIVEELRQAHEEFWSEIEPSLKTYCPIFLGDDAENPIRLDSFDVMGDVAWDQSHVKKAMKSASNWAVNITQSGTYTFELQRWPKELGLAIDAVLKDQGSTAISPNKARIRIGHQEIIKPIEQGTENITFELALEAGIDVLEACFIDEKKQDEQGAYYVYVTRQD